MNETQKNDLGRPALIGRFFRWLFRRQTQSRALIGLAALATLVAIFYQEEDWRGKRAWEKCKAKLEAKGVVLDWDKFIPPPVPDDQNFFKAPKMAEWFVRINAHANTNDLTERLRNPDTTATNLDETAAAKYLAWSDQFKPDFDLIREALKRPYARIDCDYSIPYEISIPHFVAVRVVVQTLAQRAKCDLLLGQPDKALQELTLLHDMCRLLEGAPTGKPMTLVASMINVAVAGLYAETIAYGLQSHFWREPQLAALQEQLKEINLPPFVMESFREEPVHSSRVLENTTPAALAELLSNHHPKNLWETLSDPNYRLLKFMPRGWVYLNMKLAVSAGQKWNAGFDLTNDLILPRKMEQGMTEATAMVAHRSPWNIWSGIGVPNFTKAILTTARNQTLVNEGQIACALERYRLAHGEYPESLDALVPQFIEKLPHDLIGGQPLHYRRMEAGKFLLYSVGWNETDDGGQIIFAKDGSTDREKGDWVWKN
jgi:hypothetical protein